MEAVDIEVRVGRVVNTDVEPGKVVNIVIVDTEMDVVGLQQHSEVSNMA